MRKHVPCSELVVCSPSVTLKLPGYMYHVPLHSVNKRSVQQDKYGCHLIPWDLPSDTPCVRFSNLVMTDD
jgi:hypothetical protein